MRRGCGGPRMRPAMSRRRVRRSAVSCRPLRPWAIAFGRRQSHRLRACVLSRERAMRPARPETWPDRPPQVLPVHCSSFFSILPRVGAVRPACALHTHHAEALAGGRLHHHPALEAPVHACAQLFQPRDFARDVVGFDIEVDAAFVLHALNLHAEFARRRLQHAVVAAAAGMLRIDRPAERFGPEAGGRVDIVGLATDQQALDARAMHGVPSTLIPGCLPPRDAATRSAFYFFSSNTVPQPWPESHARLPPALVTLKRFPDSSSRIGAEGWAPDVQFPSAQKSSITLSLQMPFLKASRNTTPLLLAPP